MAEEKQDLQKQAFDVQCELLAYAVWQAGYLQTMVRQQAEMLAILKKLPENEVSDYVAKVDSDTQQAISHDMDGLRKITGLPIH